MIVNGTMAQSRDKSVAVLWLISFGLCLLCQSQLRSQHQLSIYSQYYTYQDGYAVGLTYGGIAQDRFGRVWIAGEIRLVCLDGSNIIPYEKSDSIRNTGLKGSMFHSVITDHTKSLWVSGASGLYSYDEVADTFCLQPSPHAQGAWSNAQRFILADTLRKAIWLYDDSGLYSYYYNDGPKPAKWKHIPLPNSGKLRCFVMLKNGHLLLSGLDPSYQTWIINPDTEQIVAKLPECLSAYEERGTLWLGTWRDGIVQVQMDRWKPIGRFNPSGQTSQNAPVFTALHVSPKLAGDSILICGTLENGYWYFNLKTNRFEANLLYQASKQNGLKDPVILTFFSDKTGTLWALQSQGVSFISPHRQLMVPKQLNLFLENQSASILQVRPHNQRPDQIWIGVSYYGLALYDLEKNRVVKWYQQSNQNKIQSVERRFHIDFDYDHAGNLWATDTSGFLIVRPDGTLEHYKSTLNTNQAAIFKLAFSAENLGYIASSTGLFSLNPKTGAITKLNQQHLSVNDFQFSETGLVLATDHGVRNYNLLQQRFEPMGQLPDQVFSIVKHQDIYYALDLQHIWQWQNETWHQVSVIEQLRQATSKSLAADPAGYLWLKTTNNITKIDPITHKQTIFETGGHGFCPQPDGSWIVPFFEGLIRFHPLTLNVYQTTSKPIISAVRWFDQRLPVLINEHSLAQILWKNRSLTFDFSCPDFTSQKLARIEIMLEGLDNNWRPQGDRRSVTYTNLEPGQYTFKVRAYNLSGLLHPEEAVFQFEVLPPFYRTWWFRLLIFSLLGLIIRFVFRWRVGQIRAEEARKADFLRLKAETEMRALRAQMNPHFIFNCMNTIEAFIYDEKPDEASAFLQKFSKLIRSVLENAQHDIIPLLHDLEVLELYVQLEQTRANNRWNYLIEIDTQLQEGKYGIAPLLIQPFVENAILHGLYHRTASGGELIIQAKAIDKLIITIKDNGVGRKAAATKRRRYIGKKKSLGISFTTDRIKHLNQPGQEIYAIHYQDLIDVDSNGIGTLVTMTLPLLLIETDRSSNSPVRLGNAN